MATEPPRPAPPAAGRPEGGRGCCAGGGRGEAEEAAAQPALGASSPGPAAAVAAAAGGRRRGLNGCVPLSHQVAGHMYGKDKGGKRRRRGGVGVRVMVRTAGRAREGVSPHPRLANLVVAGRVSLRFSSRPAVGGGGVSVRGVRRSPAVGGGRSYLRVWRAQLPPPPGLR